MHQAVNTLMNALVVPGGCQTQIWFVQGDTLVQKLFGASNRGTHWLQPDIMVLNAGAHICNDTNFEMVLDEVLLDMARLREAGSTTQFCVEDIATRWLQQSTRRECAPRPSGPVPAHGSFQL